MKRIQLPLTEDKLKQLKAGQEVLLTGTLYTARDAAHQRITSCLKKGRKPPIPLKGQTIYYAGPTPTPPARVIGSCGPTTSSRMDPFTPLLLKAGLKGMIGKGSRGKQVRTAIKKYKAVYFAATGGTAALLSERIKEARIIAYKQLGPEAIYKLRVVDFPVIVAIDLKGRSVYDKVRNQGG